jgi:hypothetical protein
MFFVPLAIVGFLLFIALGGEIVEQLWNWLLPPLFGWRAITFWQALGILALSRILFGGFAGHRSHRSGFTPEQRERFRQGMRRRCGFGSRTDVSQGGVGQSSVGQSEEAPKASAP